MVTGLSDRTRRVLTTVAATLLLLFTYLYVPVALDVATDIEVGAVTYAAHSSSGGD